MFFSREQKDELVAHIDLQDRFGCTPLHYAAAYGSTEAFQKLLTLGANINIKNNELKTVLHFAAEYGRSPLIHGILSVDDIASMINDVDCNGKRFRYAYYVET